MARAARLATQRLRTSALLVGRTPIGEADLIVRLFTEKAGLVGAMARAARRSSKRFAALEPIHLLKVSVQVAPSRELGTLTEALLARPRLGLTASLEAMQAAGQALRWVGRAAPASEPEPQLWGELNALLDALDAISPATEDDVRALLAAGGLRMLAAAGWGLELSQCVRCSKPIPARARVMVDVHAGGVVCRGCGAAGVAVGSRHRRALLAALEGDGAALADGQSARLALALVDAAFEAHGRGTR